jgi:hypothetical protein
MWPFISSIPELYEIKKEGNDIVLFHSKGANKFSKQDLLKYHCESDVFSESLNLKKSKFLLIRNLFFAFVLIGGSVNLIRKLFPLIGDIGDPKNIYVQLKVMSSKAYDLSVDNFMIFTIIVAIIFSYTLFIPIKLIIKTLRIRYQRNIYKKDIIVFTLNEKQIKVRVKLKVKPFRGNTFSDEQKYSLYHKIQNEFYELPKYDLDKQILEEDITEKDFLGIPLYAIIYGILAVLVYFFKYDTPFWFQRALNNAFIIDNDYTVWFDPMINDYYLKNTFLQCFVDGLASNFIIPALILAPILWLLFYGVNIVAPTVVWIHCILAGANYPNSNINKWGNKFSDLALRFEFIGNILGMLILLLSWVIPVICFDLLYGPIFGISLLVSKPSETNFKFVIICGVITNILSIVFVLYLSKKRQKRDKDNLEMVSKNGLDLGIIQNKYRTKEILKRAVESNGLALQFISFESVWNKWEYKCLVKEAIKQNYNAYHFASDSLKENDEIKKLYEELKSKNEFQTENQ